MRIRPLVVVIVAASVVGDIAGQVQLDWYLVTRRCGYRLGANNQTAVILADGITDGGVQNNGAISFDVFFVVPTTVGINDFSVTAGSAWVAQCPGSFTTTKVT